MSGQTKKLMILTPEIVTFLINFSKLWLVSIIILLPLLVSNAIRRHKAQVMTYNMPKAATQWLSKTLISLIILSIVAMSDGNVVLGITTEPEDVDTQRQEIHIASIKWKWLFRSARKSAQEIVLV